MPKSFIFLSFFTLQLLQAAAQVSPGPQSLNDYYNFLYQKTKPNSASANDFETSVLSAPGIVRKERGSSAVKPVDQKTISRERNTMTGCSDTSARLVYKKDTTWIAGEYISKTKDGDILIPGDEFNFSNYNSNATLLKCTQNGDTIWSKAIVGGYARHLIYVDRAFELNDKSILLTGSMYLPLPYQNREDFMMIRLSSDGNLIWEKTFKSKLWNKDTLDGKIVIADCKQDNEGNLYLGGRVIHGGRPLQALAFKMDINGTTLWSKGFATGVNPDLTGINITNNTVTFYGNTSDKVRPVINLIAISVDTQTGDTLTTAGLSPPNNNYDLQFYESNMAKLKSGNLLFYGPSAIERPNGTPNQLFTHAGFIEITPDLHFVNSYLLRSYEKSNRYNSVITAFDDGSVAYTRINYISGYSADIIFGDMINGKIVKERTIAYRGVGPSLTSNFIQMDDGGQLITDDFSDSIRNFSGIEFMKLHNSDLPGACLGKDTIRTVIEKQPVFTREKLLFDSIVSNVLEENIRPFSGIFNNGFTITTNCKQESRCDSLLLSSATNKVCVNHNFKIRIHKNKECGATPLFDFDTSAIGSFANLNDSTIQLSFKKPWSGFVRAYIDGCSIISDSILLTAFQSPPALDLGPDTTICPGNTIGLNAHAGYASYKWQDGSSDSLYTVTKPGTYFVTVEDACGGAYHDTVQVSSHPPIPFDIGKGSEICKHDTLSLTAPSGFIHYNWTHYNIDNDTLQSVRVDPDTSTWYKVQAEKMPGCFATDSVLITVKQTPAIHLGSDTSLCEGDSLRLDAGTGFIGYQWNTGESTQTIMVNNKGVYSVKAILNGCFAKDTLEVANVYPLPSFSLGTKDTSLCEGQSLVYNFNLKNATYIWSTGTTSGNATIEQPDVYWLQVSQNGCKKSDTIGVTYSPTPVVNLGNDTTLCENKKLLLSAFNNNTTYYWQDGNSNAQELVNKPGIYFVKATMGHCSSSDTIRVNYKDLPRFTLGQDTFLCEGEKLILAPVLNNSANYIWQDGSTDNFFTVDQAGIYKLTTYNECGSYSDSITITNSVCNLIMPTAFTPNGDGLNDGFRVKYPFAVKQFKMEIYNRWGEKVFESHKMTDGWNGNYKNNPPIAGTYVWVISFRDGMSDETHQLKGTVTLIK